MEKCLTFALADFLAGRSGMRERCLFVSPVIRMREAAGAALLLLHLFAFPSAAFSLPPDPPHPFLSLPHKNHNSRSILLLLIIRRLLCCFAENTSLCLPSSQRSSLPSQLLLCGCAGHIVESGCPAAGTAFARLLPEQLAERCAPGEKV